MADRFHTGSHDLPVTPTLEAFMADDWAEPASGGTPTEVSAWTAKRREALSQRFPGDRLIVPSGTYLARSNDQDYRFRPHSDYVWLTGDQTSDSVLVLEPNGGQGHDAVLFLRPRAPRSTSDEFWRDRRYGELWAGRRPTLEETRAAYGLECRHLDELDTLLSGRRVPARVRRGTDAAVELLVRTGDTSMAQEREQADAELAAVLSELRLVKDDFEIEQLQLAVDITARGFADVVAQLPRCIELGDRAERWIEGTFWRRARLEGNDVGYSCIVAGGPHATTLHWISNDGPVRAGDLLLLDMGAETEALYTADITRTLPATGTFTSLQRELYEIVLTAQDAGMAAVQPGARFRDFHNAGMAVMARGLSDLGLLPCTVDEALDPSSTIYRRWTLCGSGHMLGLDVHDCARARAETYLDGVLQPGHVLTVEPGLYLQAEDLRLPAHLRGIGIRIEDDVVVTDTGNRNLSAGLPRTVDDIEQWMGSLS